jgi:hypothetical protein
MVEQKLVQEKSRIILKDLIREIILHSTVHYCAPQTQWFCCRFQPNLAIRGGNLMLSEKKAAEILNSRERKYSPAEVKIIKEFVEKLCRLEYEIIQKSRESKDSCYLH